MGYFKRRMDFSDAWYHTGELWRYVLQFFLIASAFLIFIVMTISGDLRYMGWSADESPPKPLLYFIVVMMSMVVVLDLLVGIAVLWSVMGTRGMLFREFPCSPETAVTKIERLFDATMVSRVDFTKGPGWRRWPRLFPYTWIRSEGLGLVVAVGKAYGSGTTQVLIGPVNRKNELNVHRLRSIIDIALMARDADLSEHAWRTDAATRTDKDTESQQAVRSTFTDAPRIRM